jgi:hypothetical protein
MIWDVHPGSGSRFFTHPGSRIRISIFYPSRIPDQDLDFLPIPDPGVKKALDPGSRTATLIFKVLNRVLQDLHLKLKIILNSHPKPKISGSKFDTNLKPSSAFRHYGMDILFFSSTDLYLLATWLVQGLHTGQAGCHLCSRGAVQN